MNSALIRHIARAYLPSRWYYYYARTKLATDPLYDGVCAVLAATGAPVLDLGCGIGLLAHCLRARQLPLPYLGLDNDAVKIRSATRSAAALSNVRFAVTDLGQGFPTHQGSLVILDVLQYLPSQVQRQFLQRASSAVASGARLVIRTGLADAGWRSKITRMSDVLGRLIGWMNTGPKHYPTREELDEIFIAQGLSAHYQPLWGNTPFNNWLVIAERIQDGNPA